MVKMIFDKFDELGSLAALFRYLVHNGIRIGIRPRVPKSWTVGMAAAFPIDGSPHAAPSLLRRHLCLRPAIADPKSKHSGRRRRVSSSPWISGK